ncbi:MAG: hypothetical protein JJU08_11300 [Rhodobacteraceae bacterium]|nr:hypothetical protein [Paracoccaceae bacterium]
MNFANAGSADPGPPLARAYSQHERPLQPSRATALVKIQECATALLVRLPTEQQSALIVI